MPRSCFERFAAAASLFLFNSLTVGLAIGLPSFLARATAPSGSQARGLRVHYRPETTCGQVETLPELRIVERHLDPERPQALNPLQLPELEGLDVTSQIAEALQVFDVPSVFQRLGGLGVDDGYLPRLCHALGGSVHDRFVDALLDDLVPD